VAACGVCAADLGTAAAKRPASGFPVTPGHEVAGVVAEVGEGVSGRRVGDRVVVGWYGGSCGSCSACRRGDVVHCPERQTPGVSYPGGWADTITVPERAVVPIPDGLSFAAAAPFGCAGVTTFNAVRNAGLRPGARVAVFGVGGLGHLAVQFAAKLGYETIAIGRGAERAEQARSLGATTYVDSTTRPPGEALAALGGADLVVYTASSTEPVTELLDGLAVGGQLTLVGVDAGSLTIPAARLVMTGQRLTGQLTGGPADIEAAMSFAVTNDIRPVVDELPLTQANEALTKLRTGQARFRIVLLPGAAA
jgi:alcohol dehydrogenase